MSAELKFFIDSDCTREISIVQGKEEEIKSAGNYLLRLLPDLNNPNRLINGVDGESIVYSFYVKNVGDKASLGTSLTVINDPLGVISPVKVEIGDIPSGKSRKIEFNITVSAHSYAQVYNIGFVLDYFTNMSDTVHDIPYSEYLLRRAPLSEIKYNMSKYTKLNGIKVTSEGEELSIPYKDKVVKPRPVNSAIISEVLE